MSVINGRLVMGLNTTTVNKMFGYDRYKRHLLLQHRSKHYVHLVDKLERINPEFRELLEFIRDNVSVSWYKAVRGRVTGFILIMYLDYHLFPQQYSHRGDLIYYANAFYIQQYLQRIAKLLRISYNYPSKNYQFKIQKHKLLKFSEYCYDETQEIVTRKMIPHYQRLMKEESTKEEK